LACGTPVIGFRRGSIPEVIREGVNGFIVHDCDQAAKAVARLNRLSRAGARSDCEARFGDIAIVNAYELIYHRMAGG
jgi:glycosyltransferase involved in cell wall biosynthesis